MSEVPTNLNQRVAQTIAAIEKANNRLRDYIKVIPDADRAALEARCNAIEQELTEIRVKLTTHDVHKLAIEMAEKVIPAQWARDHR